jgi:hypothetical protein
MNIYLFIVIIVILLGAFTFFKEKLGFGDKGEDKKESDDYKHYVKKNYLMSKAEHEFYKVLQETIKDKYYIVPQVQLSKIIEVNKYEKNKRTYFNKIDRKSVDFVLFNKEYFTPYMVIELDDSSHMLPERESRDGFVDSILNRIGIKIIHMKTANSYNTNELSNLLEKI